MMSESLGGSNAPFDGISGDRYPRFVICIDYGTTFTGKRLQSISSLYLY